MRVAAKALIWMLWALAASPAWPEIQADEPLIVSIAAPAYWCPYACDVSASRSGFAVDIARAALESEGHTVIYRNLPYDRAIIEAKSGRVDAIIPAFKGETPDFIFPDYAVSQSEYCFFVPKNEPFRYNGLDSLEKIRIVATSGYSYGEDMDAYIANNQDESVTLIRGDEVPGRLRELVRRQRYDALLDDRLLFESGESSTGLVNAGCLDQRHPGYLALSPGNRWRSSAIAEAFERGVKNIRQDGQLCEIVKQYGLGVEYVPEMNRDCAADTLKSGKN